MAPTRPNRYQHDSTDGIETGALIESAVSGIGTPDAIGGAEHYFHRNHGTAPRGEREPLLTPGIAPPKTDEEDQAEFERDWAHVPKWRRPHVFWLLGPFFIFALAFGGVVVPRLNIILDLICREYFSERQSRGDFDFVMPVVGGDDNEQCQIPEVHARTSTFILVMGLISGLISAITSPRLGSLSDRYGRRWIICFSCAGLLTSEITTILVVKFHTLPVSLLLVGALVDGICGSFMLAMALSYSYGADCTLPTKRAMAFGAFQGCLFSGMAIGPVLGGLVVEATGSILSIFYAAVVTHLVFMIYIVLILPESVSPRRMKLSKERYQNEMHRAAASGIGKWNNLNPKNLFRPLGILFPTGVGSSPRLRLNLVLLAAIDSTLFGVAMGGMTVIIMYAERMFHWRNLDSSIYLSIVCSIRVAMLFIVLPTLVTFFRRAPSKDTPHHGADMLDIRIIRFAIVVEAIGYVLFSMAPSGTAFTIAGALIAVGGVGSPTVQSALTKHVPKEKTGQLMGALALLHSLARVVAPTIFNLIYAATVGTVPQAVFICLASTFSIAFVCSWFIKPHISWHRVSSPAGAGEEEGTEEEEITARNTEI